MIDEETLLRYRFQGLLARSEDYPPKDGRYQDYLYFAATPLAAIRDCWKRTARLMRDGAAPKNVILYIHWPFCPSQCSYCFCSMTVQRASRHAALYVETLKREMDAFGPVFDGVEISSVYIGGGTPTFIPAAGLKSLFAHIHSRFKVRRDAEIYVEASPATLTASKLAVLLKHGVNRVTLGVQTRDPAVLRELNRKGQSPKTIDRAWRLLARAPGIIRDIDLMVGLEGQTRLSFIRDLVWAIRSGADVIHVNSFDPRQQTLFTRSRKKVPPAYWPDMDRTIRIAERIFEQAGYGITHYDLKKGITKPEEKILSDDPFELASVLALGKHGKAHAFAGAWYQHPSVTPNGFDTVRIPRFQYIPSDLEEEMRCYVIRSLCLHERVSLAAFKSLFHRDLSGLPGIYQPLRQLANWGKLRFGTAEVRLADSAQIERLVWLKHLYSPRVFDSIMRRHHHAFIQFKKDFQSDPENILAALALKAEARTYHRVYYKRRGAKPRVSDQEARSLALS